MTILLIIIALTFTVIMTALMLRPFSMSQEDQISVELLDDDLREVESLVARKVALVQSLRDVEYDFETHKISEEDYKRFKRSCERQALGVMRRLEAIHGSSGDWDARIDEALAQYLPDGNDSPQSKGSATEDKATMVEQPPEQGDDDPERHHCANCGKPLADDDLFCSRCGTAVQEDLSATESESAPEADWEALESTPPQREEITG